MSLLPHTDMTPLSPVPFFFFFARQIRAVGGLPRGVLTC
jgi:hypothetical protein